MNREDDVLAVFNRDINLKEKIRLLEDLELDLYNEMEAQQENMHPDVQDNMAQALMLVSNLLRELRAIK